MDLAEEDGEPTYDGKSVRDETKQAGLAADLQRGAVLICHADAYATNQNDMWN
jgi:hypothetical protein